MALHILSLIWCDSLPVVVNPQAVNEPGFDVFTANKRAVLYLTHAATGKEVAFVAIGAMLVGSIVWTTGGEKGRNIQRGEELGYFAYGGSTVVVLFPKDTVTYVGPASSPLAVR